MTRNNGIKEMPKIKLLPKPRFNLGRLIMTSAVMEDLSQQEIIKALLRHVQGDWGDLSARDILDNELSLQSGQRLVSAYHSESGRKFWIITEADRSSTCVLFPEEK